MHLPTGSDNQKFRPKTMVITPHGTSLMPLPAINQDTKVPIMGTGDGTFQRFTDDGQLPVPLQPGLGKTGASLGLFASRIFDDNSLFGRGAVHAGGLYEYRPGHEGVDPGDQSTLFASLVKPLYHDQLVLDLSYISKNQQHDSYAGLMAVPTGQPAPNPPIMIVPCRAFSGGNTELLALSLIMVPNPLFKISISYIDRLSQPDLGPSPEHVFRIELQTTFASGLFQ
jgi:hypothetical protein